MWTGKIRFRNIALAGGTVECDFELLEYGDSTPRFPPPKPDNAVLPKGYDSDQHVAFGMLVAAMQTAGLDPIGVQHHGDLIVAALQTAFPGLDVYAHRISDAIMWPGFGSIDCTIDSGRGGWYFRPDGASPYGSGR